MLLNSLDPSCCVVLLLVVNSDVPNVRKTNQLGRRCLVEPLFLTVMKLDWVSWGKVNLVNVQPNTNNGTCQKASF